MTVRDRAFNLVLLEELERVRAENAEMKTRMITHKWIFSNKECAVLDLRLGDYMHRSFWYYNSIKCCVFMDGSGRSLHMTSLMPLVGMPGMPGISALMQCSPSHCAVDNTIVVSGKDGFNIINDLFDHCDEVGCHVNITFSSSVD